MQNKFHTLYFESTRNCNFSCKYCSTGSNKNKSFEEIPYDKIISRILIPAKNLGTRFIEFSGGEFLIREDAYKLLKVASDLGFRIAIASNGSTLNEVSIKKIKNILGGNLLVSLGINSFTEENINTRTTEGEYTLEKIRLLEKHHININLSITIGEFNKKSFSDTVKQIIKFNLPFNRIPFTPRNTPCNEYMIDKKSLKNYFHPVLQSTYKGYVSYVPFFLEPVIYNQLLSINQPRFSFPTNPSVGCWVGSFYAINPEGEVAPCPLLGDHVSGGNVLDTDLKNILYQSDLFTKITDRSNLKGKCGKCNFRFTCGGCRVMAYFQSGDLFAEDPTCFIEELSDDELKQHTTETAGQFKNYIRMAKFGSLYRQ
ncbi:MAG: radical SAM protein [Bacteroidota bacterium]